MTLLSDTDLLRRLVAFDTTSSRSNIPFADFICDYLADLSVRVDRFLSDDGQKVNLLLTTGPEQRLGGEGLTLCGHMDTVPATEREWLSEPYEMREKDGFFVGRGTADMKGFLAIAVNALAESATQSLGSPLALLLTYDEEVGCLGARDFRLRWPSERRLPTCTVIGEPTSLRVARMHKGHLKLLLSIPGRAAHSGYPHLGINAIERAGVVITALSQLRQELEREHHDQARFFPTVPYVPLNIGTIEGGSATNIVPDRCLIEVGVRLMPGMRSEGMVSRLRGVLDDRAPAAAASLEVISDSPPMLLDAEAGIHRTLCDLVGQQGSDSVSFATDGGWLQELGLECVLFGPGSIEVAHKANEFLPRDEFIRGAALVRDLIRQYCR